MRIETKASYWTLWLIIAAFSAPVVLSYIWFYLMPPSVTQSNYGTLIQPLRPVGTLALAAVDPVQAGEPLWVPARWTLLHVVADCPPECRQALFYTKQTHILLNKYHERLRRVLVLTQAWPAAQLAELRQLDPELIVLSGTVEQLQALQTTLAGLPGAPLAAFYLIDPLGNAMLSYPIAVEPSRLLKDLRHLLKWSRTG